MIKINRIKNPSMKIYTFKYINPSEFIPKYGYYPKLGWVDISYNLKTYEKEFITIKQFVEELNDYKRSNNDSIDDKIIKELNKLDSSILVKIT